MVTPGSSRDEKPEEVCVHLKVRKTDIIRRHQERMKLQVAKVVFGTKLSTWSLVKGTHALSNLGSSFCT